MGRKLLAVPYKYASILTWKDLLQFGALEYQILGSSVETANKGPFDTGYKVCFRRCLSTRSHPENPISHWQPSEPESKTWERKSWHYRSRVTVSASAFGHRFACVKSLHTWPECQGHSACSCSAKPWNANESICRCIIRYETKVFIFSVEKWRWNAENHRPLIDW